MKKLSVIFLATLYFVCACGLYVHAHFCGGELSSVNYFALHDSHDCGCGDEPVDDNCCKDVLHFYKVDAHQDASFVKASDNFSFKLFTSVHVIKLFVITIITNQVHEFNAHAPPPYLFAKASKLVVNSVFRI
jgi:hypothetical protein